MDLHPPRVRYLKGYRYKVQPGDDVVSIASRFGMSERRWPELVGANPHKRLQRCGASHQCFANLTVAEPLNIPACWRSPQAPGLVSGPTGAVGVVDLLKSFQDAVKQLLAHFPVPQQIKDAIDDVAAVVYSWWTHLKAADPSLPPGVPTSPPMLPGALQDAIQQMGQTKWQNLLRSAALFLSQYGIGSGESPSVQNIPWGDIPWDQLGTMWQNVDPNVWGQLTSILHQKEPAPYSTPPQLPPAATVPDFFDPSTWTQPNFKSVPFKETTWSETLIEVVNDPRFVECNTKAPDRFAKLRECPACYSNATEFVDLLCASGDPCDCKESGGGGQPTTQPEVKKDTDYMPYVLAGAGIFGAVVLYSVVKD
jgi:hypothetical protein